MTADRRASSGTSSGDIFGQRPGAEPATPGSYGRAPTGFRLPPETRLGPVRLAVADLDRSIAFYESVLGMRHSSRSSERASLGIAGGETDQPLLELERLEGARPAPPYGRTGLFHFAILLPDRASLGLFLTHAEAIGLRLGAGDHLVSESLYLSDPDGLGIEIYADRPSAEWRRIGRELMMATDPLDLADLAAAADGRWNGMPHGTVMGHLHLRVGDLGKAADYYSAALGFDRQVWSYPGALFFGAGGYHHHLGTNVWAGADATTPTADEARLLEWTIELPDSESLSRVTDSLRGSGFEADLTEGGDELLTRDPWATGLRLRIAKPPPR